MNELENIRIMSEIIGSNILTAVALWWAVTERNRLEETNKEHKRDLRKFAKLPPDEITE